MAIGDIVREVVTTLVEVKTDLIRPGGKLSQESKENAAVTTSAPDAVKADAKPYFDAWVPARLPRAIKVTGGDNQTAASEHLVANPVEVQVLDDQGKPVQNVVVHFTPAPGSGTVKESTPRTDAKGLARITNWRLGKAGRNVLTVTVFGPTGPISAQVKATAT